MMVLTGTRTLQDESVAHEHDGARSCSMMPCGARSKVVTPRVCTDEPTRARSPPPKESKSVTGRHSLVAAFHSQSEGTAMQANCDVPSHSNSVFIFRHVDTSTVRGMPPNKNSTPPTSLQGRALHSTIGVHLSLREHPTSTRRAASRSHVKFLAAHTSRSTARAHSAKTAASAFESLGTQLARARHRDGYTSSTLPEQSVTVVLLSHDEVHAPPAHSHGGKQVCEIFRDEH
mmetsp:Transcript_6549/g.21204  ORF Transcript_6549/g.21204 Transcript_6549/m.21204 type:complete len:231 (+) Transcript_6549:1394-2086(+)